jgi:hypothetical protein
MTRTEHKFFLQRLLCIILFFLVTWTFTCSVPCHAQQFDLDTALVEAAKRARIGELQPWHEMLILDNIKRLGELNIDNKINHLEYSLVRIVYEEYNFEAAKRVAARYGMNVTYQKMKHREQTGLWPEMHEKDSGWTGTSDIDLQVTRKPGKPLITDKEMQIIEAQYRQELRNISDRKAREAGIQREYQPEASGITDIMIDPDATTDVEWDKYVKRHQRDLIYTRRSAARVEHQLRGNKSVDPRDGWQYIQEMLEMREKVGTGDELKKYYDRINQVLNRMQKDHDLPVKNMEIGPKLNVTARDAYLETLAGIAKNKPEMNKRMGHLIALQLYDLPEAERNAVLKRLNLGEDSEVSKNINLFNLLKKGVHKEKINMLRQLLQQTSTGQYLLVQWDYDLNALDGSDRRLMEFFQKGGVFDSVPDVTYKSLQTAAMLVEMLNRLQRAQSDADMAMEVAKTVAQYTQAGMIAGYVQLGLQGDPESMGWALALYICPKAAIPSLVKSIGISVGDMAASTVFDAQFQHLYENSNFNENGELIQVLDYGGPNPACAFVSDIREPGAFRLLTDKLTFTGANALLTAIKGTIYGGTPLVLKDNHQVQSACAEVNHYNEIIDHVLKVENVSDIAKDAGPDDELPRLSHGGEKAVKDALTLRSKAHEKVLNVLCVAIKDNLESRYKAEQALGEDGQKQIDDLYAWIEELFRQLDIHKEGVKQLRHDAGMDADLVDKLRGTSTKERNIKIMETLTRYYVAYSEVLRLRTAAEGLVSASIPSQKPAGRILTGFVPLTADPNFDAGMAAQFVMDLKEMLEHDHSALLFEKRKALCDQNAQLDSDFDRRILQSYLMAAVEWNHHRLISTKSTPHILARTNWYQVPQKNIVSVKQDVARMEVDRQQEVKNTLLADFKEHYKTSGPDVAIVLPAEVAAGRGLVNTPYVFSLDLKHVPDHAEFAWFEDDKKLQDGRFLTHSFSTQGQRTMRVRVAWKQDNQHKCEGNLSAELVVDIPANPADSPELNIGLPAPLDSGPGKAGQTYSFTARPKNIPDDAIHVWYLDQERIGEGRDIRKVFDQPRSYMLAVHAQWAVKGQSGVVDQAWGRARLVIEAEDEENKEKKDDTDKDDKGKEKKDVDEGKTSDTDTRAPATAPDQPDDYRRIWGDQDDPGKDDTDKGDKDTTGTTTGDRTTTASTGITAGDPTMTGDDDSGTDGPKDPPIEQACIYEYGIWTPVLCDKGTKQTLEYSKKPEGCIEKEKPIRERDCKPITITEKGDEVDISTSHKWLGLRLAYLMNLKIAHDNASGCSRHPQINCRPHFWVFVTSDTNLVDLDGHPVAARDCTEEIRGRYSSAIKSIEDAENELKSFLSPLHVMVSRDDAENVNNKLRYFQNKYGSTLFANFPGGDEVVYEACGKKSTDRVNGVNGAVTDIPGAPTPSELGLSLHPSCPLTVPWDEVVTFTATASGGEAPYTYAWSGEGHPEGQKFSFANANKEGQHTITVTATDKGGKSTLATCQLIVDAVVVEMVKTSPAGNSVRVGEQATFKAIVTSGGKPVSGDLLFHWYPIPDVRFGDANNPLNETTTPTITATFIRPGDFDMYVSVLRKAGEVAETIGESNVIPMTVGQIDLQLSADKPSPRIGDKVVVTVKEEPGMKDDDIAFVWNVQGDVLSAGAEPNVPNHRAHSFVFTDVQPVTVNVQAMSRHNREELGTLSIDLSALEYEVSISEPKSRGPKPRIWKCDGQLGTGQDCGFVDVENQFAVFQDIDLSCEIEPEHPDMSSLRYKWSISQDGCGLPGRSRDQKINCSQTGAYTVGVEVRDKNDIVLGKGERSVDITISADDLDGPKNLVVTLQADPSPARVEKEVTLRADVQGGKGKHTYTWSVGIQGNEVAKYTPAKPGKQNLGVKVVDAAGKTGEGEIELDVQPEDLAVTLACVPESPKIGETATLTATITGGTPQYKYVWKGVPGSGENVTWTPDKSGELDLSVEVTDENGKKADASLRVVVQPLPLEVKLNVKQTEVKPGDEVSVQAEVSGGKPDYEYAWTGVTGQKASATWKAEKSGKHKISVQVTDADGNTADDNVDLTVTAPALKVELKSGKAEINKGETVNLTATVTGGDPEYDISWSDVVDGEKEIVSWTPKESGKQTITVTVTDKSGQTKTDSASVEVNIPKLEVKLTSDPTQIVLGGKDTTVTLTAEISGGDPKPLKISEGKPSYDVDWGDLKVIGVGETVKWTPVEPGEETVTVTVTDESRQTQKASTTIWVLVPLEVKIQTDPPDTTTFFVGDTVPLSAEITGGTSNYALEWGGGPVGREQKASWEPEQAGEYTITLKVRDRSGLEGEADITLTVQEQPSTQDDVTVELIADNPNPAVNEPVALEAKVSGGKEPYSYTWMSSYVQGEKDRVLFTSPESGKYKVYVEVRDADQEKMAAFVDIHVQPGDGPVTQRAADSGVIYGEPFTLELKADKTEMAVGETLPLEAVATGGVQPYTFNWYPPSSVQTSEHTAVFVPMQTGNWVITVEAHEAGQVKRTANIEILVRPGPAHVTVAEHFTPTPTSGTVEKASSMETALQGEPSGETQSQTPVSLAPIMEYEPDKDKNLAVEGGVWKMPEDTQKLDELITSFTSLSTTTMAATREEQSQTNSTVMTIPETYASDMTMQPNQSHKTSDDPYTASTLATTTGKHYDGTYRGEWYPENTPDKPTGTMVLTVHKSNATVKLYDLNTEKERDSRHKISGHVDASGNLSLTSQSGSPWRGKIVSSQAQGTWETVILGKSFRGTWRATLQKQ